MDGDGDEDDENGDVDDDSDEDDKNGNMDGDGDEDNEYDDIDGDGDDDNDVDFAVSGQPGQVFGGLQCDCVLHRHPHSVRSHFRHRSRRRISRRLSQDSVS